jgi:hypothetical protein
MPKNNESLNKELYSLLKTRGFDPIPKDATGETSPVPDDADVFKFTFKHDNQVKGTAYATIDGNNTLTVYYDDEVVSEEVGGVDDVNMSWTNFLKYLKMWAQRRQMGFDLENKDHLHSDMAQRDYVKKQEVAESKKKLMSKGTTMPNISEGYYAMGKNSSYNDNIPTVKIILQHSRQIQEGEQRYRNVARIYLENTQGERFLAPTVKPGIAQVYARHLAEGGSVNDERWNHIKSLCEEYSKMAGFVRAVRGNQFNESAQKLVEAGLNHYVSLRETLGKMRGNRGYNSYFESWTPTLMETDGDETSINELFVQETLDPRIESVMPILSKLSKNLSEVKEVKELEEWANGLLEAPGAETLAHNQSTAKSNLKAFDLEEDSVNEGWFADTLKSVGKAVLDKLAPNDKQLLLKLQRDMGVPTTAQHGKPSMARMMSDEEVQKLIAAARKVNAGRNSSLSEEEVEESGLQAYLGNKKYGKDGMDSLRKAGREGASKEKMAKIRAKYDKLDEEGMDEGLAALSKKLGQIEEDLGPEQKRVGQLGPTEKVKKNSGARGKLVGANESVEQGVAEGSDTQLSIQQLATISDEALDNAYGYGRSSPGNTFGWQANLMSAAYAKKMIDAGVTDIEKISDAIHKGWNVTAQKFVQNPDQFDDTEKLRQAGKLEAKLQQRAKLMKINYAQLDNEEQEKDRVVARALLQAIKNQQGVAEGKWSHNAITGQKLDPRTGEILPVKEKPLTMKQMFAPKAQPKLTLDDVWRKVENVVSQIYPDGDPNDYMAPWLEKHGIRDFKIGEILDRAAKKNGYKDMYDYWNSMGEQGVAEGQEDLDALKKLMGK